MSMRKSLLLFLLPLLSFGQKTGYHSYTLDLINVEEDRVKVTVDATKMNFGDYVAGVEFNFPATIPGTYATLDYGRFIKDFKVYGASLGEFSRVRWKQVGC